MNESEDASSHQPPSPLSSSSPAASSSSGGATSDDLLSDAGHQNPDHRNLTVRGIIPALHHVRDSESDLLRIGSLISRFATDPEPSVRAELAEQLPPIACFCLNANNNSSTSGSSSSDNGSAPDRANGGNDQHHNNNNNNSNHSNGSIGGKSVPDSVYHMTLGVLEQLLTDGNSQVRRITQNSLSFMLEKRLVDFSEYLRL